MCGIVGIIDRYSRVQESTIKEMNSKIIHRGPDDEGIYCHDNIGLGMRRLSIIDLSGGHQPISNENNTLQIVFNGEIYNYKELQKELASKGHQFKTKSDTEVILHLYEDLDTQCVHKLNGMFSFAIWDETKKRIFIARDRMGIKPLYFSCDNKNFLFASEIKSLLFANLMQNDVSSHAIWDFLTFRYIPEPNTIWEGIKKLPPAHWLLFNLESWNLKIERYWDIPFVKDRFRIKNKSDSDYVSEFSELFEDAVKRHLYADVPTGVLLSGGLDSSAVLSAVKHIHDSQLFSFSVGFDDGGEFSELEYAREMARSAGAINHEIVINHKDLLNFLQDFVWFTDEPLADLASIPLYYVSKLAAGYVKVVLSGEGSDEVLGGYDLENIFQQYEQYRAYRLWPRWLKRLLFSQKSGISADFDYYNLPSNQLFHMTNLFSSERKNSLFKDRQSHIDSMTLIKEYYARAKGLHPLNQILYVFSQSWLVEDLLMKADKMTMANSIELRVPFLDYRIVEWAAALPVHMKIGMLNDSLVTKKILRMYCTNKIPDSIINRTKKGFPVPAYNWLSNKLKAFAIDLFNGSNFCADLFDLRELNNIVTKGTTENSHILDKHRLWVLIILEIWLRRWKKK